MRVCLWVILATSGSADGQHTVTVYDTNAAGLSSACVSALTRRCRVALAEKAFCLRAWRSPPQPRTAPPSSLLAGAGDALTCPSGHALADIAQDIRLDDWCIPEGFANWRGREGGAPSIGDPDPGITGDPLPICPVCGESPWIGPQDDDRSWTQRGSRCLSDGPEETPARVGRLRISVGRGESDDDVACATSGANNEICCSRRRVSTYAYGDESAERGDYATVEPHASPERSAERLRPSPLSPR